MWPWMPTVIRGLSRSPCAASWTALPGRHFRNTSPSTSRSTARSWQVPSRGSWSLIWPRLISWIGQLPRSFSRQPGCCCPPGVNPSCARRGGRCADCLRKPGWTSNASWTQTTGLRRGGYASPCPARPSTASRIHRDYVGRLRHRGSAVLLSGSRRVPASVRPPVPRSGWVGTDSNVVAGLRHSSWRPANEVIAQDRPAGSGALLWSIAVQSPASSRPPAVAGRGQRTAGAGVLPEWRSPSLPVLLLTAPPLAAACLPRPPTSCMLAQAWPAT